MMAPLTMVPLLILASLVRVSYPSSSADTVVSTTLLVASIGIGMLSFSYDYALVMCIVLYLVILSVKEIVLKME